MSGKHVWVGAQLAPTVIEMRERIALLEYENRSLKWRKITEKDLPKKGDETLNVTGWVMPVTIESQKWNAETWARNRWTHFRPINPPLPEQP
jgi:hypothetical protein